MESWYHNIWFRRLWPPVVLAAAIFGYSYYSKQQAALEVLREDQIALATAKLWVASAIHRHEPDVYARIQDSVLTATGLKREFIEFYMERYKEDDVDLASFADKVKFKVDSLIRIEQGIVEDSSWQDYILPEDTL